MNNGDKYIILFYEVNSDDDDPTTEENAITSPLLIRDMCKELMKDADVYDDKSTIINQCVRQARAEGMKLVEDFPPAFGKIGWGDWVEVARKKKYPNERMYLVKVVDAEITEIDRNMKIARGG